mmetsp:Transcript_159069/g.386335  ORF Transcript_159069/g.386335 Transcript_159069/m.386335 type:complete len:322 (+) Transcript_159069:1299-2264(+)
MDLGGDAARLGLEQAQLVLIAHEQTARRVGLEQHVDPRVRERQALRRLVLHVLELDHASLGVQHSKPALRLEDGSLHPRAPARLFAGHVEAEQLVGAALHVGEHKQLVFGGVERVDAKSARLRAERPRMALTALQTMHGHVRARAEHATAQVPFLDVVHESVHAPVGRAFALQFKHNAAGIVAGSEQVMVGMGGQHPEPVVLAAERLYPHLLAHIPDADGAVLGVGEHQLLARVEQHARHIVCVAAQGVHLPRLGLVHTPKLDLAVIGAAHDQRNRRMEARPVHAAVVALEHVLDNSIGPTEQIGVHACHWIVIASHRWPG